MINENTTLTEYLTNDINEIISNDCRLKELMYSYITKQSFLSRANIIKLSDIKNIRPNYKEEIPDLIIDLFIEHKYDNNINETILCEFKEYMDSLFELLK